MKPFIKLFFPLAWILTVTALAGCSKSDDEKSTAVETKEAPQKPGVTMAAAAMGLKIESPLPLVWQPEVKGFGSVIVPATLAASAADLAAARSTAELSSKEYERQQMLAAQTNASIRVVETAKAAAQRDELASEAAQEKFKLDWGSALAKDNDREKMISKIINGEERLVRIDLPAGETLPVPPTSARMIALASETNVVTADFFGAIDGVNPQTQSQSFFFLTTNASLFAGAAVTGFLKTSGDPINGVVVPVNAVLRHEGKGWVYVQAETNQFVRTEIPLDRLTEGGWFVSGNLSVTNRIVVTGAQTILSAELSGGGFNTGERD